MATKGRHGKGAAFEKRYLKRILEIAPEYESQFRKIWHWDDYPDNRGADLGIDLVAENKQGERVAIQAKCYAPDGSLSWPDLSTFYGDAMGRKEISKLMLVTTTDNLSRNAEKKLRESEKDCAIVNRSQLKTLGIPDRTTLSDLEKAFCPPVEKHKPRPHQKTAIKKTLDHLEQHKRGQLLMACGTGKTLVGLWIREQMEAKKAKRTIVFVPSIALLRQTWKEWTQQCSKEFYSVAVCSDERATRRGGDPLVSSPSAVGLPPTTDPDAIAKALDVRGPIVVFSTYQSSEVVEEAIKKSGRSFDLMIADEAHNTTSVGLTAFTRPLYQEHIPARRRLFFTATPRIVSRRSRRRAEEEGYDIHSMDDTEVYGEVAYRLRFSEAIKKKLLTDYEIFVVGVDDADIADAIREREFLKIDDSEINGEELAAHIAIHRAMKKRGTRRMITFHSRINQAETFSRNVPLVKEWLRKNRRLHASRVWGNAVSGNMDVRKREKVLERFDAMGNDEHGIVSNARCLGEGVDVPTIDGISFVQPKRSPIDIVQAVGRAIRKSKKKKGKSTIILPVPILDTSDPTDTIESSAFETVWRVLESLRAHDDELEETLDTLRTKLGARRFGKVRLPKKLVLDLPRSVNAAFNDAIQLQVLEHSTEDFWEGLGYLTAYKEEHGDCRVNDDFVTEGNFRLGRWVGRQRSASRAGRLPRKRVGALNELGFIWDPLEDDFQRGLSYLKAYKEKHGHCRMKGREIFDGFSLGSWVLGRRKALAKGQLSQERIDVLDALGFIWDALEDDFQRGLGYLKAYKKEFGDCSVPALFDIPDKFNLGTWVSSRRADYKNSRLPKERIEALDALGFIWDEIEELFQVGLGYLKAYKKEFGHSKVPIRHITDDGYPLGAWVSKKREEHRAGKERLTSERIDALNSLGFVWDPFEKAYQRGLGYLKAYKEKHGHCNVSLHVKTDDGYALGSWVANKRTSYRGNHLSDLRIKELNALGFSWDIPDDNFQKALDYLKAYKNEFGDCRVPGSKTVDGFPLGNWVGRQRKRRTHNQLDSSQIDELNELGFIWDVKEADFQEGLGYLKAYKKESGDCRVPQPLTVDGFPLGGWVSNRRGDYKEGQLSPERIKALNSLGFTWDISEEDFQKALDYLKAYKKEFHDCRVRAKFMTEDDFPLGKWVSHRRGDYKKGQLSPERIETLNALGFIWDAATQ